MRASLSLPGKMPNRIGASMKAALLGLPLSLEWQCVCCSCQLHLCGRTIRYPNETISGNPSKGTRKYQIVYVTDTETQKRRPQPSFIPALHCLTFGWSDLAVDELFFASADADGARGAAGVAPRLKKTFHQKTRRSDERQRGAWGGVGGFGDTNYGKIALMFGCWSRWRADSVFAIFVVDRSS